MKDVIIACDFSSEQDLFNFLDKFGSETPYLKIGMELYYACGPDIVKKLKARGHKIFLDLKLCDIPNTVMKAMSVLSNLDVDMCNIHATGTTEMMKGAIKGLTRPDGTRPLLIAVTLLTSIGEDALKNDLLINEPLDKTVMHLAKRASECGLDGVVCSPLEAQKVKDYCGQNFITVTPGIRFSDSDKGDQTRIATPEFAKNNGSTYIVVGRPITASSNPLEAYLRCKKDFLG